MGIHLVPVAIEHAAEIQALASDPLIAATSNIPYPYPPDGALTWIRHTMAQREMGREMNFAMLDDALGGGRAPGPAGRVVGVCGVLSVGGSPRSGELGYWVGVPYWRRGYASTAARTLLSIVFEQHDVQRLRSSCLVRNGPSFRVLEKCGFRLVGYGSHPSPKWTPQDRFAMFELTRDEWRMTR